MAASRGGHIIVRLTTVRHILFAIILALYIVTISQNWAVYTASLLSALWVRYDGRLDAEPFAIGKGWAA